MQISFNPRYATWRLCISTSCGRGIRTPDLLPYEGAELPLLYPAIYSRHRTLLFFIIVTIKSVHQNSLLKNIHLIIIFYLVMYVFAECVCILTCLNFLKSSQVYGQFFHYPCFYSLRA